MSRRDHEKAVLDGPFLVRGDGRGGGWRGHNPDNFIRLPVFRSDLLDVDTPDERIVHRADDKVFKVEYAYRPVTRRLLKLIDFWFPKKAQGGEDSGVAPRSTDDLEENDG